MTSDLNTLTSFLAEFCKEHLLEEKTFVVPSYQLGHQIGEVLTSKGYSWVNLRFATLPSLAFEISAIGLSKQGIKQISESTASILVERAFRAIQEKEQFDYIKNLKPSSGVIRAIYKSIRALRMEGILSDTLSSQSFINNKKGSEVKLILGEYEEQLKKNKLIDKPGLYLFAIEKLEDTSQLETKYNLIFEDEILHGLERQFLKILAGKNLIILPQDVVLGVQRPRQYWKVKKDKKDKPIPSSNIERTPWLFAPYAAPPPFKDKTFQLFRAVGPSNESKEVLRRIMIEKVPLDEVEIIHPQGKTYSSLFYLISEKIGLPVTFGDGVSVGFTSPGKVFNSLIDWLEGDFQASVLWKLIESGDLKLSFKNQEGTFSARKISSYLKRAGIGWGKERYVLCLKRLKVEIAEKSNIAKEDGKEEGYKYYTAIQKELMWLIQTIKKIMKFCAAWGDDREVDFGTLCHGLSDILKKYAQTSNELDGKALSAITSKLEEITSFQSSFIEKEEAIKRLRDIGERICVNSSSPIPGHLHLSSYKSGGFSGRSMTFIVGLSQDNFLGLGLQDPILLDEEREDISESLETTKDTLNEKLYSMARLISSLRGKVTLSFPSYDIVGEKQSFPSSIILQALRLIEGNADLDYTDLSVLLPEATSFFPVQHDKSIDGLDWWLSQIVAEMESHDGLNAIKDIFPTLGQGIDAQEQRVSLKVGHFEGILDVKKEKDHPLLSKKIVMSASRFECLAYCPFQYFLTYVLGIKKPELLEYDPSRWLDHFERGKLIHEVFFEFMKEVRKKGEKVSTQKHRSIIREIGDKLVKAYRDRIPPPSQVIFEREKSELIEILDVFLSAEEKREKKVEPLLFEVLFGHVDEKGEGIEESVSLKISPQFSIFLNGRIDRIDRVGVGKYRIIDYKSGKIAQKYENLRSFGEGRILQHALYSLAAEEILRLIGKDSSARVVECGYFFPTRKGEGREIIIEEFDRTTLMQLLAELLTILISGHLVPSPNAKCTFCDFQPICGEAVARAKEKKDENPNEFGVFERLKDYK